MKLLLIILIIIGGLATCHLVTGCKIFKHQQSSSSDTTSVTKMNESTKTDGTGGFISKDESKSKGEYERTTMYYPQLIKDTNIINLYPQFTTPQQQPAVVIHEKGTVEQSNNRSDSGWYYFFQAQFKSFQDSMNAKMSQQSKDSKSETKGLGLFAIIGIGLGFLIVGKLLGKVNISIAKSK